MIDPTTWIAFIATAALVAATPGPTAMLLVSYGLSLGRRGAWLTVPAVIAGDLTAMVLSLAGLGALLAASANLFTVLKWIGAAYLIVLGVGMWRATASSVAIAAMAGSVIGPRTAAVRRHVYLVTALNPKSMAFYVAFLPQFVHAGRPAAPQMAILALTFLGIGAVNALAYALIAGHARAFLHNNRSRTWLNRAGGSGLIAAGMLLGLGAPAP